jgi:ubiquitin carboxyl-terminal hydrolase 5/13
VYTDDQQLEHNLKFDFSMTGDDGRELRPMFGKGLTGLKNLGNSCYMASVMQTLLALPAFRNRYFSSSARNHSKSCDKLPADCLECQMLKLADGLISGRYSVLAKPPPVTNSLKRPDPPKFQEGVRPAQFKALIGKGHSEFSTMRQQDSQEFFLHVMDKLRKEATRLNLNPVLEPTKIFQFGFEERLECNSCHRVGYKESPADDVSLPVEAVPNGSKDDGTQKYKSISLEQCFRDLTASERLTDYKCEICKRTVTATK